MAAKPLTATEFIADVAAELDGEYSKADIKKVLGAVAVTLQDCLAEGYKVNLTGVGRFEPRAKAGRKKGDLIRNPFDPEAPPKKVTTDEPTKVVVKAFPAAALKNSLPGPRTKKGKELAATLLAK
jgi:nucleoid DNA-binding protein